MKKTIDSGNPRIMQKNPGEFLLRCVCGVRARGFAHPKKFRDEFIANFWKDHTGIGHRPTYGTERRPLFKGSKLRKAGSER